LDNVNRDTRLVNYMSGNIQNQSNKRALVEPASIIVKFKPNKLGTITKYTVVSLICIWKFNSTNEIENLSLT